MYRVRNIFENTYRLGAEVDASNTIKEYVHSTNVNSADYIKIGSDQYKIIKDHLGSPRLVVNASTGAIAQKMSYNEWGYVIEDTNPGFQPFGFAGGLYDSETKLVKFGARDYDGRVGRWLSKDPIRFEGGDTNLYGYVISDPINFHDPEGEAAFLLVPVAYEFGFFLGATYNKFVNNVDYCTSYDGWSLAGKSIDAVNSTLGFFSNPDVYRYFFTPKK